MTDSEKRTLLSTAVLVHLRNLRQQETIDDRLPTSKSVHVIQYTVSKFELTFIRLKNFA